MADSNVAVTAGTGTNIDTRTEATNGHHRQVVVLGDPATNAGVAPVDATAGLKVDLGADNDITGTVTANLSATDNAVLDAIEVDTTSIDAKIPALGQALAAASVPVILPAATITTLTPPAAITGFSTSAKQDTLLTELQLKADLTETQPVSMATAPALVAGSALIGKVGIDQVTANANEVVTKTGSVTAATLSAETTKVIGTVNIAAAQTLATVTTVGAVTAITNALPAGTNAIGKLSANTGVDIGDIDVTSIVPGTGATNLGKAEDGAHTTGDVGVFALGVRSDTLADVSGATGDYTQMSVDLKGRVMVGSAPRTLKANQVTTITSSTTETTIVTAVASTFLDLYGLIITNTSATAVNVAIKDGTAGTTRLNIAVPAGDTRGFMLPIDGAIKQSSTNANWTATSSASVASLVITALTVANL